MTFRIVFGSLMGIGAVRFMLSDWIEHLYLEPHFFFKYYGFECVQPFNELGMYLLFGAIATSAFCMMLGLFYRLAAAVFFLTFSYSELIDASNYLNHYYLVGLLGFLMIFLPANRAFSLDTRLFPSIKSNQVPAWTINILIFQLTVVYTFAGIAKLQPDWLFRAMPLAVWLPEHRDLPILGYFFQFKETAYLFSWAGAFYDLTIAYFLMFRITRPLAYVGVIVFHLMTHLLFNIGLFPFIMIFSTLIFLSADFHKKLLGWIGYKPIAVNDFTQTKKSTVNIPLYAFLGLYSIIQITLPLRHLWYDGDVLWTEEGYRLSWRVMVLEKNGLATFTIKDSGSERQTEITNSDYLTTFQEKQMSIQPDFIVQYAHFLAKEYEEQYDFEQPQVYANVYVARNGRISKRLINENTDLAQQQFDLKPRSWILKYSKEK